MRYAIVIEKTESNYAAYVPDLPGCVTTAATIVEVDQGIREAIELHIAGLREDGQPIPQPSSQSVSECGTEAIKATKLPPSPLSQSPLSHLCRESGVSGPARTG